MGSKTFLLLGISLAIALLISSEVVARELAETAATTTSQKNTEAVSTDGRGGYNAETVPTDGYSGGGGCGGGGCGGGGGGCHGGGCGGGGGGCYGGGCGHHCRYGYCRYRCCNYAGEVVDAKTTEEKPQN